MRKKVFCLILILTAGCQYFQRSAVVGPNYYERQWDRGIILLREQNIEEAEPVFKELYASAQKNDPELATKALFELAQISERKGQWLQALSQFKECETKKYNLVGYKAELELPARLAGLYATLGEIKISESYAKKVESNIQTYMMQINMNQQKGWWAETFYRMGSFPVRYLNGQNWIDFAKRFHSTSQHLIKSMELSDPLWSVRSLEMAQSFFRTSFELIAYNSGDLEENNVLIGTVIRDRINLLEEILQKIQLYKPLNLKESRTVWLFYQAVEDYQAQVKNQLYRIRDSAPLSKESQERNAIVREGDLKNPSIKGIDKNSTDPNL